MVHRRSLALAAAALLAAGCGNSAESTESETATEAAASSEPADQSSDEGSDADVEATTETTLATASSTPPDESDPDTPTSDDDGSDTTESDGGGDGDTTPEETAPDETAQTTTTAAGGGGEPGTGAGPIDESLRPLIDKAVADLTQVESLAPSDITVESAELVEWGDASAGCPQPGMQYAQVITDGSAIHLMAKGKSHWYHTGGASTDPVRCTSGLRQPPL